MPDTVTVACKLPHGFVMQVYTKREVQVNGPGGLHWTEEQAFPDDSLPAKTIAGVAFAWGEQPKAIIVPGGFALTPDVPFDLWEAWKEQFKNWPPYKAGCIYAVGSLSDAQKEAQARETIRTGLEPLDQDNPGPGLERMPVSGGSSLG